MITKKTNSAIELCVLLAGQKAEGYLSTKDLSQRLGISISYIETILKTLRENNIVFSMKGPGGGYMIEGDASVISMWDIACLFETTLENSKGTGDNSPYAFFELELEQVVVQTLKSFTLSDFAVSSSSEFKANAQSTGRFKFKPLQMTFMPKAPNSVFQLGMSF